MRIKILNALTLLLLAEDGLQLLDAVGGSQPGLARQAAKEKKLFSFLGFHSSRFHSLTRLMFRWSKIGLKHVSPLSLKLVIIVKEKRG